MTESDETELGVYDENTTISLGKITVSDSSVYKIGNTIGNCDCLITKISGNEIVFEICEKHIQECKEGKLDWSNIICIPAIPLKSKPIEIISLLGYGYDWLSCLKLNDPRFREFLIKHDITKPFWLTLSVSDGTTENNEIRKSLELKEKIEKTIQDLDQDIVTPGKLSLSGIQFARQFKLNLQNILNPGGNQIE